MPQWCLPQVEASSPQTSSRNPGVESRRERYRCRSASLIPDLPPVPPNKATLVGGTLERLDRVRDQVTVKVFGGGRVKVLFDPRTRVFRGQKEVTIADLKQGERIYLDTMLDGDTVFARNIRLNAEAASGQSQGILQKHEGDELTIRDGLAPLPCPNPRDAHDKVPARRPICVRQCARHGCAYLRQLRRARKRPQCCTRDFHPGASWNAIHVHRTGGSHRFATGLLVLNSSIDHKTYEIYLNPQTTPDDNLQTGANVTIMANFENSRYVARSLSVNPEAK